MFTAAEAAGLVMATLEGHTGAHDPADVVGGALAKIVRALPERVAPAVPDLVGDTEPRTAARAGQEHLDRLLAACGSARVLRLSYRLGDRTSVMEVEPWAVVLRHSRWYLLCWSRSRDARRVLRVDRMAEVEVLPETFSPPPRVDARSTVEEHLSQGWRYPVEVLVDAPPVWVRRWVAPSLARLEPAEGDRTRMLATTDDPDWYARQLAAIPVAFRLVDSPELAAAVGELGRRLLTSGADGTS